MSLSEDENVSGSDSPSYNDEAVSDSSTQSDNDDDAGHEVPVWPVIQFMRLCVSEVAHNLPAG